MTYPAHGQGTIVVEADGNINVTAGSLYDADDQRVTLVIPAGTATADVNAAIHDFFIRDFCNAIYQDMGYNWQLTYGLLTGSIANGTYAFTFGAGEYDPWPPV